MKGIGSMLFDERSIKQKQRIDRKKCEGDDENDDDDDDDD